MNPPITTRRAASTKGPVVTGPSDVETASAATTHSPAPRAVGDEQPQAMQLAGRGAHIADSVSPSQRVRLLQRLICNTIEQAPIGIAYWDRAGHVLMCNGAFSELLGYDVNDLSASRVDELLHQSDVEAATTDLERLWNGEVRVIDVEKRYLRKDGTAIWVRTTSTLVSGDAADPDCAVEFVRDISTRKVAEVALQQSRSLLNAVIADLPVAIRACDVQGQVFLHNRAAAELFHSVGAGEFIGQASWAAGKAADIFEADGVTPVEEANRPLARALRGETVTNMELVVVSAEGQTRRSVTSARRLVDNSGVCLGAVAVTQDVTQQRALARELVQAQKLESIGQLSAGIAHEINTPTQFIGDNIRFLDESYREIVALTEKLSTLVSESAGGAIPAGPIVAALNGSEVAYLRAEVPKAIAQSLEGIDRIAKIVGAMKEFSHPGLEKSPVDLNRAIDMTITVASNEWKYVADVKTELDANLPLVPVIPGAFNQVILNMIVNAAHAIGDGAPSSGRPKGLITVATRLAGDTVEIDIRDNGCGMAPKTIARIFDPFFTTKPVGKGTGQGLAIAHDVVVNKHGGTVSVDSTPGVGTTFTIRLPLQLTRDPTGGTA